MGSRATPQECKHGKILTWGSFGPEDGSQPAPCPDCEQEQTEAASRFESVLYGEVSATAGHGKHSAACNCQRTVNCILQRMRSEPGMVYAWLAKERRGRRREKQVIPNE